MSKEQVVYEVSPSALRPMYEVQTFELGPIHGGVKHWVRGTRTLSEESAKDLAERESLERQVQSRVVKYG